MDLSGKRVAVYGLGVSGQGALKFLSDKSLKELIIVNRGAPKEWKDTVPATKAPQIFFNEADPEACKTLSGVDFILLAPGIAREVKTLKEAHEQKVPIWNELELASRFFDKPILALTGTNGKTTSVSFMAEVFSYLGRKAFVGGNIGRSFLEGLSTDTYDLALLEVSSFQCESLETLSPEVAGILNLFPNHGERYDSNEDYRQAKWKLSQYQKEEDHFFVGPGCEKPAFSVRSQLERVEEKDAEKLEETFDLEEIKIVGAHNRYNLWFSWLLLKTFASRIEVSEGQMKDAFQKAIASFKGVEHRIEYVGENEQFLIFNDAKSTNWDATMTALRAMEEKEGSLALLIGGQLRGHNDEPPVQVRQKLKECEVFFYGASRELLSKIYPQSQSVETIKDALLNLREKSTSGTKKIILLSPAFPSFDQFGNYAQRGCLFKELCQEILLGK